MPPGASRLRALLSNIVECIFPHKSRIFHHRGFPLPTSNAPEMRAYPAESGSFIMPDGISRRNPAWLWYTSSMEERHLSELEYKFTNDTLFKMVFVKHQDSLKQLVAELLSIRF
jgi:hypothetical protein